MKDRLKFEHHCSKEAKIQVGFRLALVILVWTGALQYESIGEPKHAARIDREIAFHRELIGLRRQGRIEPSQQLLMQGANLKAMDQVRDPTNTVLAEERRLLADRLARSGNGANIVDAAVGWGVMFGLILSAAAGLIALRENWKRRRSEETLGQSEMKFHAIAESVPQLVWMCTPDGLNNYFNPRWMEYTGLTLEESYARGWNTPFHPDDKQAAWNAWQQAVETGDLCRFESRLQSADGGYHWFLIRGVPWRDGKGNIVNWIGTCTDIDELKSGARELRRAQRALRTISHCNEVTVQATEESQLLRDICETLVTEGGYRMAWVGCGEDDELKSVRPVAYAGFEDGYLKIANMTWADDERGQGPAGTAMRTGKLVVHQDFNSDITAAPWQQEALKRGFASSVSLPISVSEHPYGAITIYADQPNAFDSEEIRLLTEMGNDLEYGLQALRSRAEQKRAEAALMEERHLLHTLMDNIPDLIYFKDLESRFTRINLALAKSFGLSQPSEAAGKTDSDFYGSEHARQAYFDEQEIIRTGQPVVNKEEEDVWPEGDVTWVSTTKMALRDATGKIIGTFGVSCDITASKRAEAASRQSEQRFRQIAETIDEVFWEADPNTSRMLYVSPAYERVWGRSAASLYEDPQAFLASVHTEDREQVLANLEARKAGLPFDHEYRIIVGDQNIRWIWDRGFPICDEAGQVVRYVGVALDITARKSLETQVRQAAKMQAVGKLAGGIAHDLNNLLTIINGYSDIVLEDLAGNAKVSGYLKEVWNAGERAASLTRQLLAFSRQQVLSPQVLDLNSVISDVERMLRRLIGEDIELLTILSPSLGRVKADPGQIEQVIMNLAVNARDAMPTGGILTIETSNVEIDEGHAQSHPTIKPGPYVVLSVADTGVGMTPETKASIFEPFFTTKEPGKGTGLGLATVYGIVKQSEGSIWAYSELGHGTIFKIYLPVVNERLPRAGAANAEPDSSAGTETILLVEDEEGVRSLARLALVAVGYQVLDVKDGNSALATCSSYEGPIHLLLTDVVMPQMSGPDVASKIAAERPGIRVLYTSGYTDDAVVRHGVFTQKMPFIQKPYSPKALRQKVREVLEIKPEKDFGYGNLDKNWRL